METYNLLVGLVDIWAKNLEAMGACVECRLAARDRMLRAARGTADGRLFHQDALEEIKDAYLNTCADYPNGMK